MLQRTSLLLLSALSFACSSPPPPLDEADPRGELAACDQLPEPAGWDRARTEAIVRLGGPVHSVQDAINCAGDPSSIRAKLSYGPTSADLEGERVQAWIRASDRDGCSAWRPVGVATTDDDGRVAIAIPEVLEPGLHAVAVVVLGDVSTAYGFVHVLEPEQPVVVFDIDGTLTTSDVELVDGIVVHHVGATSDEVLDLAGSPLTRAQWLTVLDATLEPDAAMHADADEVAWWYAERGVQPVYITGRPYLYDAMTRDWLAERGLPAGPLVLVQDILDALPANVDDYKERALVGLRDRGLEITAAYGNALTDVCAYARAGVDPSATFIIGPNAGAACERFGPTVGVERYDTHLADLGN